MSRTLWLITYDVRDARRLRRLRKACLAFGWPLQYSVFLAHLDATELLRHEKTLRELITDGDALSMIPVSTRRPPMHLGEAPLPHLYPDDPVLLDVLHPVTSVAGLQTPGGLRLDVRKGDAPASAR